MFRFSLVGSSFAAPLRLLRLVGSAAWRCVVGGVGTTFGREECTEAWGHSELLKLLKTTTH